MTIIHDNLSKSKQPITDYMTLLSYKSYNNRSHSDIRRCFKRGVIYVYDESISASWKLDKTTLSPIISPDTNYDAQCKFLIKYSLNKIFKIIIAFESKSKTAGDLNMVNIEGKDILNMSYLDWKKSKLNFLDISLSSNLTDLSGYQ